MDDGYAIQRELLALILADGDEVIGYNVGVTTSRPMQRMLGVDSPDYGPVLRSTVYADGDVVPVSRFISPKVEAEIVFVLGSGLRGPGVTVEQARGAITEAYAGREIVDCRIEDWRSSSRTPSPISPRTARWHSPRVRCRSPSSPIPGPSVWC